MIFNSYVFLFYFLPLVIVLCYAIRRMPKAPFLLVSSYFFYGWWRPEYMLLMLFSTMVDFFAGLWLGKDLPDRKRRWILFVSIAMNVGLLSYFKYTAFLITALNDAIGLTHVALPPFPLPVPEIILPIGISFYTFQSISYTFDCYRRHIRPTRSFIDFAAYIALFPQLVAGPIVRARTILPYIRDKSISRGQIEKAIHFFTLGLAKKVLIADTLGIACDVFHQQQTIGPMSAWLSIYADVFHWYFDFSGYSDMAIGLGYLFGFAFPQNFNSPLRSASMTELVVKWHMTLITWFRDYVYIPLGGNRKGPLKVYRNLFIIMFLSGVWHGAGWTYIIWALMMALALVVERALGIGHTGNERQNWLTGRIGRRRMQPIRIALVLTYYSLCVSVFTAPDVTQALAVVKGLVGLNAGAFLPEFMSPYFLTAFVFGGLIVFCVPNTWELSDRRMHPAVYVVVFLVCVGVIMLNRETPFMYFRF
jgi:alginate O-acetyltransferase complex protein AlgI